MIDDSLLEVRQTRRKFKMRQSAAATRQEEFIHIVLRAAQDNLGT